jgi:hypothetical protein
MILTTGVRRIRRIGFPREVRPGWTIRYNPAYWTNQLDKWIVVRRSARYLWIKQALRS